MKEIKELFDKGISHGYSPTDVFDDFLNLTIISIININKNNDEFEENEKTFQRIIKKYDWDMGMFSKILACFVKKMEETKDSFKDWIWEYFMQVVSHGEHGQFFTPDHIANLCSKVALDKLEESKFPSYMDCACGSSRMLLQAQQVKRGKSYGTDIDRRCVLMSAFNHFFYGLVGQFTVWNTLMNERREVFEVMPPFIYHKTFT